MKCIGYESYTSWIITIGACIINCTSLTPYRIAGLMYVSIIEYYETDRETASIPVLIFIIVRCLAGPFCGILGEKFGAENVTLYGSILAAVGFGGCFLARNIIELSIYLGIIFGLGMTGSNTLLPYIVKKFFKKNINSANGIGQAGSCLGAIFIPPFAVYLLNFYGLPGTFLIVSALMLHAVPISLIIKYASLIQDKIIATTKRNDKLVSQGQLDLNSHKCLDITKVDKVISMQMCINNQKNLPDSEATSMPISINDQESPPDSNATEMVEPKEIFELENKENCTQMDYSHAAFNGNSLITNNKTEVFNSTSDKYEDNNIKVEDSASASEEDEVTNISSYQPFLGTVNTATNDVDNVFHRKTYQSNDYAKTLELNDEIVINPQDCISDTDVIKIDLRSDVSLLLSDLPTVTKPTTIEKKQIIESCVEVPLLQNPPASSPISNRLELHKSKFHYLKVFLNPSFLIIMILTGLHNYVSILVWTTMIDYSRDKGISRDNEVYFLMIHPLCELAGRISLGWITDLGYLTMSKYSMICFSLMGLTCGCVLCSADFWMMMLGALTFALSTGAMTAVFPGMVFAWIPEELQTMAIASRYTLSGFLIFTSAPLIGFFRENHGSYDGIYYLLIICCLICVAIMPLMEKLSSRSRKVET